MAAPTDFRSQLISLTTNFVYTVTLNVQKDDGTILKSFGRLDAIVNDCDVDGTDLDNTWNKCALCQEDNKPDDFIVITKGSNRVTVCVYNVEGQSYKKIFVVVFRGTSNIINILADVNFRAVIMDREWNTYEGRAHSGFWKVWNDLKQDLCSTMEENTGEGTSNPIIITGHSLGAATASICALDLFNETTNANTKLWNVIGVLNFESPLCFDKAAADNYRVPSMRVTNTRDPVTHMPKHVYKYVHVGPEIFLKNGTATLCEAGDLGKCSQSEHWWNFWPMGHCTTKHYLGFDFCQCDNGRLQKLNIIITVTFVLGLFLIIFLLYKIGSWLL